MTGFVGNIEDLTLTNENFRKVIFTGQHSQLVLMTLQPNEDIGMEVHETVDQFFRFEKGTAKVIMNGEEHEVSDGFAVVVPAGTRHNIINTSATETLKLYTIYSPPNHPADRLQKTKAEAMAAEEEEHTA
ncbi:MAG: cupin domain-containing protein [Patescibacteria group bacterium]|nr:cupin domain-containing protein [Patescibacteria group bacterium]